MTIFPMHKRTLTRAAGVSPPWRTFDRAGKSITNHVRRTMTTGPGAAGVSPPWCSGNALAGTPPPRKVAGDRRHYAHERRCSSASEPTGGLRPPLLYCVANVCRRKNDFSDAQTHVHKSGGRQPAVGVSIALAMKDGFVVSDDRRYQERRASARRGVRETHLQERRRKVAGDRRHYAHERRCSSASEPTGGLRPPLLYCVANVRRRKNDFFDAQTHAHKSGGRQPAVVRKHLRRLFRKSPTLIVARQPPWFGNALARASVSHLRGTAYHGWLTPAALDRMRGGVCTVTLVFRRFVCVPRGAYAPRSCIALRTSVGEKTIFSMHKRTFTGAAGVSPPWRTLRRENRKR
jgi:hypothetical protein